jgi:Ca-activated chloride channel homolog
MLVRSPTFAFAIALLALVGAIRSASAEADPAGDKTLSPYFVVEGADPSVDRLPLKDTQVSANVSGVIAEVTVRQTYANEGQRPIHARYVFPASTRAAVHGMRMLIGDVAIVAKIAEKKQAEATFEKAKSEGKNASLLEQDRPNVFTMSVANIVPNQTVAVELRYTELLVPTDGVYELAVPTVVGPRYSSKPEAGAKKEDRFVASPYQHEGEAPKDELSIEATVSAGMPIYDLASISHRITVTMRDPADAHVVLDASEKQSARRDFILRYRLSSDPIASGLLLEKDKDESFFLVMAQPPRRPAADDVLAREYVFVVDVSGSMSGFPLDTAKKLMKELLGSLRPTDRFDVVLFASGSKTFAGKSVAATPDSVARAIRFVDSQPGGGGTELGAAVDQALAIPKGDALSRSIVLVTDGYIEAEKDVFSKVRSHLSEANVFAFGIGSSVNRYLIEGIARAGQGEPFVVTDPSKAKESAARFREYVESPVLTDIKLAYSGIDAYDIEPRHLPDLFASRPIVAFGKFRGAPKGTIEITGRTAKGPFRSILPVSTAMASSEHGALGYLWARTRIGNLLSDGKDDAGAKEVTALGLSYGLLTPYTSFVAVSEVVRNPKKSAENVDQLLPMPLGVSDLAVGGVTGGAEPELGWVLAAALALGLFVWAKRREALA